MTFRNHIYFLIFLIHRDVLTVAIKSRHSQAYLRIGMTKQYDFMVDLVKILIVKEEDSVKMLYFLTYVYGMDSVSPLQTRSLFREDLFISSSFTLDDQAFVFRKNIYISVFSMSSCWVAVNSSIPFPTCSFVQVHIFRTSVLNVKY